MARKKYRVRTGSIDTWVQGDSYTDALNVGLKNKTSGDKVGSVASVLLEGDDESLCVMFQMDLHEATVEIDYLPEADFSSADFVWHQSSESYYVCEKNGYNLEAEQIDSEDWRYCVTEGTHNRKIHGRVKGKMQAVGRCEGYCLLIMACANEISHHIVPR